MKKSVFCAIGAVILAAGVTVAAAIGSAVNGIPFKSNIKNWFNGWGKGIENVEMLPPDDTSEDGISIATYAFTADDYAAYGISEQAIEAGVLTAEYKPFNTTNKRTGWTFKFAGNEWSQGKVLSDYVLFTPGANYAPECTYQVLQPFGDTIIAEATSRANSALKATTRIDYILKYSSIYDGDIYLNSYYENFDLFGEMYSTDECCSIVPDSFSADLKIYLHEDFENWMEENYDGCWGDSCVTLNNVTAPFSFESVTEGDGDVGAYSISQYYYETGSIDIFRLEYVVRCYYEGELMYTFGEQWKLIDFTPSAFEEMSTSPTNIITPDHIIV